MDYLDWNISDLILSIDTDKNQITLKKGFNKFLLFAQKHLPSEALIQNGKYYGSRFIYNGWILSFDHFIKIMLEWQVYQQQAIQLWNQLPDIFKIYDLLKRAFDRNFHAHTNHKQRHRFYNKKHDLIGRILHLSQNVSLPFYSYGKKYDNKNPYYPVLIYFQFKDQFNCYQLSFHADDFEDVPDFEDEWIGIVNEKFPCTKSELSLMIKRSNLSKTQLAQTNEVITPMLDESSIKAMLMKNLPIVEKEIIAEKIEPVSSPIKTVKYLDLGQYFRMIHMNQKVSN